MEERKRNLEIELFEAQTRNPVLTKEQILFALYNFRKIDISTQEGKQRLIDVFVNSIYLYDDHFVITYNYKGQSKTVTFEELNSLPLTSKGSPTKNTGNRLCFFVGRAVRRGEPEGFARAKRRPADSSQARRHGSRRASLAALPAAPAAPLPKNLAPLRFLGALFYRLRGFGDRWGQK